MFRKYSFEGCIAAALFIALFFVILIQIFGRTSLFTGPIWTEELARWLWVWMALIGIGAVERDNAQLRMSFLVEMLPSRVQTGLAIAFDTLYFAVVCKLIVVGYGAIMRTWDNETVSLPTTDAVLYASTFVALILILHRIARRLFTTIFGRPTLAEDAQ